MMAEVQETCEGRKMGKDNKMTQIKLVSSSNKKPKLKKTTQKKFNFKLWPFKLDNIL